MTKKTASGEPSKGGGRGTVGSLNNSYNKYIFNTKMNKYLAEFIGTILFIYVILATGNPLAIGATLALVILIAGPISGGHINPAVSVVMASAGKLDIADLLPYMLSQVLGGMVALELYKRYRM
jgi:glycerol uptake facilitator-like aquaporin